MSVRALLDHNPIEGEMRSGGKRFWTGREHVIMREYYPREGLAGCVSRLPGRSATSIYQQARILGLKAPITPEESPQRYASTEAIDEDIRRTYAAGPKSDDIRRLAFRNSRPRRWITNRAARLGLVAPRFKRPPWTPEEDEIVREQAHRHPKNLARILKGRGFDRSPIAVEVRIKRLGATTEDPNHWTATGLGRLMGVDVKTVTRWIDKGWLKAKRRGTERTDAQGGDQWWISRQAARSFIVENAAAVNVGRCDKFWLIDLLAGAA